MLTLGVGFWVSRVQNTAGDYFLGARDLPPTAIMLSIVATETSALTVISVPAIAARGDLTFLQLTFGYLIGRLAVAMWLLPGYFRGEQETAYARLETRFGPGTRRLTSVVFLATRFLGDGVRVFASAIPLALLTGWSIPVSIIVMSVVTMIYTWHGGLKAVVWVDVLQLIIYVAGGLAALWVAWQLAGGPEVALTMAREAGKLRVFDFTVSLTSTYTFLGGLVGGAM
ncbi:MAG: sodium:solute symporter family transporter, partial [Gemmatimonadales bacterium]